MRKFVLPAFLPAIALTIAFTTFAPSQGRADIPVYLKLDSRFPSGVHPREWLEARSKENQIQRWFRVTFAGRYGWLAEDHVLTAIKLSSIARMVRDEPDRGAPALDAIRGRRISKGAQVIILEVQGSWSRGRVLGDGVPFESSWILNEALERDSGNQIERGMTSRETPLRVIAKETQKPFDKLPALHEFTVLNSVSNSNGQWIEIQLENNTAWIERKNVWLPQDLRDGSIRAMQAGLELRSSPLPNADIVARLDGTEVLKVISTRYLRWARAKVPEHGMLWWPISEDLGDGPGAIPPLKLSTQDLLSRKIYDMAASHAIPGLRFASAKGLFKSRDGIEWSKIPKFEDKNYPVVIAKSGLLFVGPYLSNDNGENFEQWIRWDLLVETLKKETGSAAPRMRLSKLEVLDDDGKSVRLIFDLGRSHPVRVSTPDRGLSWKVL